MAKENLFEMGANFENDWSSDNKNRDTKNKEHKKTLLPEKHQLYFSKEKRRGKVVTIVKPFCLEKKELQSLLKSIKKNLGTGGTVKEDSLEFQGELKEQLKVTLTALNYRFRG